MNDVKILSVDFEEAVKDAKKGDFIYFDPPYDSDTSTFNSYTENGFGKDEQLVALNKAKTIILSEMTEELKSWIVANYGDLSNWISNQIEASIYKLKN